MVVDAVRTYLDAANGLTELSRKQAVAAAKALLKANGPAVPPAGENEGLPPRVGQSIQTLAGELIETSQSNRAAISALVRSEVEYQLERMDVVPRSEHERLVRRVAELERRLAARPVVERALVPVDAGVSSPVGAEASDADTESEGSAGKSGAAVAEEAEGSVDEPGATGGEGTPQQEEAASDGKAAERKSAAKSGPRPAAKATRTRPTAKRTTKGRGAAKK